MRRSHRVFNAALVIMFFVLALQLYHMQIVDSRNYSEQAKDNRERIITKKASRGIIYDRNGKRLVVNNPSYSVAITPADLPDASSPARSWSLRRARAVARSLWAARRAAEDMAPWSAAGTPSGSFSTDRAFIRGPGVSPAASAALRSAAPA